MEPRILLTGRNQSTLDVLVDELKRYGRDVTGTVDRDIIAQMIRGGSIDFVVVGGALDDSSRSEVEALVKTLLPDTPVHLLPRTPGASPAAVIPFVNGLAVLFKVHAASAREGQHGTRNQTPADTHARIS